MTVRAVQRSLADLVPRPDFEERHSVTVAAPMEAAWTALQDLELGELRLARALLGLRALPARLGRRADPWSAATRALDVSPVPVLAADPPRALVMGAALQPWKLRGEEQRPDLDYDGLQTFDEPGWTVVGMDFTFAEIGGATVLSTETRIVATDPRTRKVFGMYWHAVRAGSGLVRRDILRGIGARATA